MMRIHVLALLSVALLSITACSRPRSTAALPAATSDDLARLQGDWRIESSLWNGRPESAAARTVTFQFRGNRCIVLDKDGNPQEETIELLPDRRPKGIDRRSKTDSRPTPGIYSLDGDTFTWCSASARNRTRPTSFSSKPGSWRSLLILKRVQRKRFRSPGEALR